MRHQGVPVTYLDYERGNSPHPRRLLEPLGMRMNDPTLNAPTMGARIRSGEHNFMRQGRSAAGKAVVEDVVQQV